MQTNEDLMSELIYNAESGKHRQFQLLCSWQEYSRAKKVQRGHLLLVSSIKKSAAKLFKRYCADVATGNADVVKLLAYCSTIKVLRFYEEELTTITDMVDEYETYLICGNWLDFILGSPRPVEKLFDHRGK